MYIVRDKKTKQIIHINPAPLLQVLEGKDIYYQYNSETMEIGKTDLLELPEHYIIDSQNNICQLSLEEQVKQGIIQLGPSQKIVDNQVVEKTISEKIKDGLINLDRTQKVVGSGAEEIIINKTPSEMINEKIIELSPFQKIIEEGDNEKIVVKTLEEQLEGGLIELTLNQRIENDKIVTYTNEEMLDKSFIDLDEYKRRKIEEFSDLSFVIRRPIIPDYKLANVGMGIYNEAETKNIIATVQAFRDEFYNLKKQIEEAENVETINAIKENYPRVIVNSGT